MVYNKARLLILWLLLLWLLRGVLSSEARRRWWGKASIHLHAWRWRRHGHSLHPRRGHTHWRRHPWRRHRRHAHSHLGHDSLLRRKARRGRGCSESASKLALIWALESRHGRPGTECDRGGRGPGGDGERVVFAGLGSEQSFCGCAVAFALAVFFECILDCDCFIHQELSVHGLHCGV